MKCRNGLSASALSASADNTKQTSVLIVLAKPHPIIANYDVITYTSVSFQGLDH